MPRRFRRRCQLRLGAGLAGYDRRAAQASGDALLVPPFASTSKRTRRGDGYGDGDTFDYALHQSAFTRSEVCATSLRARGPEAEDLKRGCWLGQGQQLVVHGHEFR